MGEPIFWRNNRHVLNTFILCWIYSFSLLLPFFQKHHFSVDRRSPEDKHKVLGNEQKSPFEKWEARDKLYILAYFLCWPLVIYHRRILQSCFWFWIYGCMGKWNSSLLCVCSCTLPENVKCSADRKYWSCSRWLGKWTKEWTWNPSMSIFSRRREVALSTSKKEFQLRESNEVAKFSSSRFV